MKLLTQKELIKFKGIWHSIKKENIEAIFSENRLEARTTQRYWKNGMVYRDNERDVYENSHYMKGWSFTRDKDYAFSWGCVTLLLDWDAIKRDFKTKPISWNYRSAYCRQNFDKEREEFIVSNIMPQTFEEIKEEYFEITDRIYDEEGNEALDKWRSKNGTDFIEYWQRKGKRVIDFDKYLLGIFIRKSSFEIYKGKGFDVILKHPLFKGFISGSDAKKRHENSMQKRIYKFN